MIQFLALALLQLARPSAALVGPPQLSRSAARLRSPVSQSSSRLPVRWPTTSPARVRLQPLQATAEPTGPVVNTAMVRSIIINQIVVGYSIWLTNGDGRALLSATQFDPTSLVIGAAGGLAVIAVGRFIEKSPNPLFAELNLSTNMLVLRLFGPRPQPIVAGVVSLGIATLVALTEETVFRGVVTSRLAENLGAIPGAGCAILLFALGHINPLALGKETLLLFALQVFTGTSFTLLAFATGGLAAPIVAHCLYDWYTFYESHLAVTGQMEYSVEEGGRDDALKREFRFIDTNRDGKISPDELRIALFSFGQARCGDLASIASTFDFHTGIKTDDATAQATFAAADTDASGDVSFEEFARFVKNGDGDASKAFKRGLLGVA